MLRVKDGVSLYGLQPEMLWAIDRVKECYEQLGEHCTITSARGDRHSSKSRHYSGLAVDFRNRNLDSNQKAEIDGLMREALGIQYDVIPEPTHIHVEYDPKHAPEYFTKLPG